MVKVESLSWWVLQQLFGGDVKRARAGVVLRMGDLLGSPVKSKTPHCRMTAVVKWGQYQWLIYVGALQIRWYRNGGCHKIEAGKVFFCMPEYLNVSVI